MTQTFYSNGKILISGEYLVLQGARALVLPLKVGQQMKVSTSAGHPDEIITWNARVRDESWFNATISISNWQILNTNDQPIAEKLVSILSEAERLNKALFNHGKGYEVTTRTSFEMDWGFGSSSALVANIARWANIDPFELHFRVSEGSGADVAGAISDWPILYRLVDRKPLFNRVDFSPPYLDKLWLIYTGIKQNTESSVRRFKERNSIIGGSVDLIDRISSEMIQAKTISDFMQLMREHENVVSRVLDIPQAGQVYLDFPGEIKSLGAWGGDFILAASETGPQQVKEYFKHKNMHTIFSLDQIMLR